MNLNIKKRKNLKMNLNIKMNQKIKKIKNIKMSKDIKMNRKIKKRKNIKMNQNQMKEQILINIIMKIKVIQHL